MIVQWVYASYKCTTFKNYVVAIPATGENGTMFPYSARQLSDRALLTTLFLLLSVRGSSISVARRFRGVSMLSDSPWLLKRMVGNEPGISVSLVTKINHESTTCFNPWWLLCTLQSTYVNCRSRSSSNNMHCIKYVKRLTILRCSWWHVSPATSRKYSVVNFFCLVQVGINCTYLWSIPMAYLYRLEKHDSLKWTQQILEFTLLMTLYWKFAMSAFTQAVYTLCADGYSSTSGHLYKWLSRSQYAAAQQGFEGISCYITV